MRLLDPRRGWISLYTAAVLLLGGGAEAAESAQTKCRFEALTGTNPETGRVAKILDGRSFVLEDGREVRLAGIEVPLPRAPANDATGAAAGSAQTAAQAATAALQRLLADAQVSLRRLGPESDRYGRLLAHAFLQREGGQLWAQQELIRQGHARVAARLDPGCAGELLATERVARNSRLGLWQDAQFHARPAEKTDDILADRGRFALVEGKILSVRESGGTVYLNFDRRWFRGFAVTVLKRNERLFAAAGMELKKLEGRRVRIRGWVEERGGPRIEAQGPEQIEIAERN